MSEAATGPVRFTGTSDQVIDWLRANGVQRVRVEYCDYGGVSRVRRWTSPTSNA